MKIYTVKPEGINLVRNRVLLVSAVYIVIILAGIWLILPDIQPLAFGFVVLFVLILSGLGFQRGLKRLAESWPTFTLTIGDDYLLKQQAYYPDIRISREEVKTIRKASSGEIAVRTRDWKKFIVIPPSLDGIEEVEDLLGQWKTIKQFSRTKRVLYYVLSVLIIALFLAAARSYLKSGTVPDLVIIIGSGLVILVLTFVLMGLLNKLQNLDERSKPKR